MLRKSLMATMVATMLVLAVTAAAFAQGAGTGAGIGTPGAGTCINGGDLDGDGVCDNWIDADGDGVNDIAPQDGSGSQYGQRGATLQAAGGGQAVSGQVVSAQAQSLNTLRQANYVDNNGDSVCDSFADGDGDGVNDGAVRTGASGQNGRRSR